MKNSRYRNGLIWLLLIAIIIIFVMTFVGNSNDGGEITFTELVSQINSTDSTQKVDQIEKKESTLTIHYDGDDQVKQVKDDVGSSESLPERLIAHGANENAVRNIDFKYLDPSNSTVWWTLIINFVPILLIVGFIFFMLRQAQGSNNQAMQFGRSRARLFSGDQSNVTFDDVAGAEESKEELAEVVEFLKEPEKFIQLGARIPKGVLLVGSPGTGKTLLAKAVAGEAGVPFFGISGSEFVEMFVGVGASRVRDLFDQAKRHSPCIVFVDEIDAVGRQRGTGMGGSHDEREQTLNQILVEMDGFDTDTNVIVVAATNRPDILDPALMRPGRFDRRVVLDRPDMRGRHAILKVHTRGKPLAGDVDLEILAKSTPGLVGADIANLVNEAAILAARKNKKSINMRDFEEAIERVILGPERKSRIIPQDEREVIAYHEAGHAVVMHILPKCDPVRKVTIVSRGMAGGVTWSMPENDSMLGSRTEFTQKIAGALGGRAAEEIAIGEITNGASNDLQRITQIARTMVTRWGMSTKLGPRVFGKAEEMVFLGREITEQRDYSENIAELIDEEVYDIVSTQYEVALNVLNDHRDKLEAVAQRLLEIETLERADFLEIMGEPPEDTSSSGSPLISNDPNPNPAPDRGGEFPNMGTAPSPA